MQRRTNTSRPVIIVRSRICPSCLFGRLHGLLGTEYCKFGLAFEIDFQHSNHDPSMESEDGHLREQLWQPFPLLPESDPVQ